ncbi:ABC transporter permease [Thiothrix subterranea]|uniref:ABC transporter permease n=1 Tax=Thiothrix subterranea TaxID=2735563 RepID=A0AA51MN76_9GAMM|nr:ABC transporter permease [Thiothrix subterranea]MDQ5769151.1 ABC transporter permease [Thiothrix subterranea]WML87310.1 ABC transporter permease [Thiothrix subterranea]
MLFKLQPRPQPSQRMVWLSPLLAIALMLLVGMVIFTLLGQSPIKAFHAFFIEPINDMYGLGELLIKASPLALIALGLSVGFRANVWNIGAEGQLTIGAIAAGGVALWFYETESLWVLPLMLIAGALGGMLWAAIPALLRTRFHTSEILVSLMLVYVAQLLLSWLVHGPWRDPDGFGFPQSRQFTESAILPIMLEGTRTHAGIWLTLIALVMVFVFMRWSVVAFQMRVAGLAPRAADYAGFNAKRTIWIGLLTGGAAAGIAGMNEIAGPIGQLSMPLSPGYGFAAIIVAFVGRLHPIGILLASLLMALLYLGGESAQMQLALPAAVSGVFQGLLLFFLLATDVLIHFRLTPTWGSKA